MVHQPPPAAENGFLGHDFALHSTPVHKPSRSDVHFPLSTPRRSRPPSITSITDTSRGADVDLGNKLSVRVKCLASGEEEEGEEEAASQEQGPEPEGMHLDLPDKEMEEQDAAESERVASSSAPGKASLSIEELPLEVQGAVLDYIFGDLHSILSGATHMQPGSKNLSSSMRHPRRKAVSDLALVSPAWRDLVQERVYRHIKIKGTRAGLRESEEWFMENLHLTRHIRHIEFWVPVWGDKTSTLEQRPLFDVAVPTPTGNRDFHQLASQADSSLMTANEVLGFNFKLSVYSATLSEIFQHISCFFPSARVFTLEGGHCKKSNMIRHFPQTLFPDSNQTLQPLPNITTFAMRGAWNVMREHADWLTIERALPNLEEWHCGYAKPKVEAYLTINQILLKMPLQLRHVNISLDGFYCKESVGLGNSTDNVHLCQRLGRVAPQLESLSFTGKICSCFWTAASEAARKASLGTGGGRHGVEPRLQALEIVVKRCCRLPVQTQEPENGETFALTMPQDNADSVISSGAGITNMVFIRAFERLTVATVKSLDTFSLLKYIRIRFIDLDSPCPLLNPYFQLQRGKCYGLWNEEILELLPKVRPGLEYEELSEGINPSWRKDDVIIGTIYPRTKPKSIKSSSYSVLADTRT